MITTDFEYYCAQSITEAVDLFKQLSDSGIRPLFYNGGTEIITLMRINSFYTHVNAVIDIKRIPECSVLEMDEHDYLVIGASVPLAKIEENMAFPLLSKNCSRIADHTSREKITLGGNVCGHIKYKEAILPLLLTNSTLVIADEKGLHEVFIQDIFDKEIILEPGSFIVQFKIEKEFLSMPYINKKMTKIDRIGYPLITVSAIQMKKEIRFAFSGLCETPFYSYEIDDILNNEENSIRKRINAAIKQIPEPILDDIEGSASYRKFVLSNTLEEIMMKLNGGGGNEAIS